MDVKKIAVGLISHVVIPCLIYAIGVSATSGGEISQHNAQHTALLAATNHLMAQGCKSLTSESSRYVVESIDLRKVRIISNQMIITCTAFAGELTYIVVWQPPTRRTNGTVLRSEEIAGYEFMRGSNSLGTVQCCVYKTSSLNDLRIRTIDTDNNKSAWVGVNW